jgi:hypothetical protein
MITGIVVYAVIKIGEYFVSFRSIAHSVRTTLLAKAIQAFLKPIRSIIFLSQASFGVIGISGNLPT